MDNTELEFLRWFYCKADFGPAHSDIMDYLHNEYVERTGKDIPAEYKLEDE